MEDKEFIAQMAQFSALEQMQNLNQSFSKVSQTINEHLLPGILMQQATTMIGKPVAYYNPEYDPEVEDSKAVLSGNVESVILRNGIPYCVIQKPNTNDKFYEINVYDVIEIGASNNKVETMLQVLLEEISKLNQPQGKEGEEQLE